MDNKAIFLDRDGTINVEKHYLHKSEDFEFLPGTIDALKILQEERFKLIIITNQSGIGRGYYTEEDFINLNSWMIEILSGLGVKINKVYYCPHLPDAKIEKYRQECECRKPKLGLFYKALVEYKLDVSRCYAIGDKVRDCALCSETNCRGYLIGNNESKNIIHDIKIGKYKNVQYVDTLYGAAREIISNERSRKK